MKILVGSTSVALWHDIIHEAEAACTISLKEELEAYLVFLLMRYMDKPQVIKQIIAQSFLEGLQEGRQQRQLAFQEVGDKCLIFSGLFPHLAAKRLVKISYFVNVGQSAYANISRKSNDLYSLLATHFVPLMDTLQAIRRYSKEFADLMPLEAYELWQDANSKRAFNILQSQTQASQIRQPKN